MIRSTIVLAMVLGAVPVQAKNPGSSGLAPACKAATQNIVAVCGAFGGRAAGMSQTQALCFQREAAKAQAICGMKNGRIVDRSKLGITSAPDLNYKGDHHH